MLEDMNPKTAKLSGKKSLVKTFLATPVVLKQLSELGAKWGENMTQVIFRCISKAWENEFSGKK